MPSGTESITRVRRPKVDKLKPASGITDSAVFDNCQEVPRATHEAERGWVGVGGWDIYCFNPDCDVKGDDQVIFRGVTYNVDGEPQRFSRRGQFKAVLVKLKKVT